MKKRILLISIPAFLAVILIAGILVFKEVKFMKLEALPETFTYTAHTGCVDTSDNTLESIDVGVKYGADIIEFDLSFLPDGTPVLSHDEPKGNEPTLDEAFKRVSEYEDILVNVDVKTVDNLGAVYPLAQKHGIEDRIFYTGIGIDFVDAVKKDSPEVPYYLNMSVDKPSKQSPEYLQSLVDEVKENGAIGINFNKDNATKELVDYFHENDLLVSIWTVNNKAEMHKILFMSPDNITTKQPDKMQEVLG